MRVLTFIITTVTRRATEWEIRDGQQTFYTVFFISTGLRRVCAKYYTAALV